MAKIKWKESLIDSAIVVVGGTLVKGWMSGVSAVQGIISKIPEFMGVDTQLLVWGFAAYVVVKTWVMK